MCPRVPKLKRKMWRVRRALEIMVEAIRARRMKRLKNQSLARKAA